MYRFHRELEVRQRVQPSLVDQLRRHVLDSELGILGHRGDAVRRQVPEFVLVLAPLQDLASRLSAGDDAEDVPLTVIALCGQLPLLVVNTFGVRKRPLNDVMRLWDELGMLLFEVFDRAIESPQRQCMLIRLVVFDLWERFLIMKFELLSNVFL